MTNDAPDPGQPHTPDPGAASPLPPPPPPPPAPPSGLAAPAGAEPPTELVPEPAAATGGPSKKGKVLAAVAAAVVLLAGVLVTVRLVSSRSDAGGAASPDEAVEQMMGSLEENDLLGVLDVFAPWERDFARDLIDDYLDTAKERGLLAEDTDLSDVPGYALEVDGLEVRSSEVNERIANVEMVAGTVRLTTQFDELPLGDEVLQQIEEATGGADPEDLDASGDLAELDLPPITTIEDDGRWYVSLFYTAAETARAAADAPAPSADTAVPSIGADSPEEAVDEMIAALERLDVRRIIELTPPDEMGVLHDYAPLFIDELTPTDDGNVDVGEVTYRVDDVDGGKKVIPTSFTAVVTGDFETTNVGYERTDEGIVLTVDMEGSVTEFTLDELEGGSSFSVRSPGLELRGQIIETDDATLQIDLSGTVEGDDLSAQLTVVPDGDCILVSGDATSGGETEPVAEQLCPEDFGDEGLSFGGSPVELADLLENVGEFAKFERLSRMFDFGVVTVEVDGKWYVSPLRSTGELFSTFASLAEGL